MPTPSGTGGAPRSTTAESQDATGRHRTDRPVEPVAVTPFDDYLLIGALGRGGMAEVHLALQDGPRGFRKLVVIKRLLPHLADEPGVVQMFLDEARLAARLEHPHVVRTEKVGEAEGRHFIAMEYLDGEPVSRIMREVTRQGARIPLPLAARIGADALDGLAYAHGATDYDGTALGVVHRDVSPQNLFVTYQGMTKLLDFGIAKAATQEGQTRTGFVKGKFGYLAPEQARGGEVDARADLFGMGVVLWEILAGKRLFKGRSDAETLEKNLFGEVPDLRELAPDVPHDLAQVVMAATAKRPGDRPETALEMKRVLERYALTNTEEAVRPRLVEFVEARFGGRRAQQQEMIKRCVAEVEGGLRSSSPPGRSSMPPPVPAGARSGSSSAAAAARPSGPRSRDGFSGITEEVSLSALRAPPSRRWMLIGAGAAAALVVAVGLVLGVGRSGDGAPGPGGDPAPPGGAAREPVAAGAAEAPGAATGTLTLTTIPAAQVTIGDRLLGTTPLRGVELPAGRHRLTLTDPASGTAMDYEVSVPPGERVVRRIELD
ncbi:MAG TPA: serine/threonine-protein kinase [Polyangiaceae bacterium LLY-WYZ-14_1]|nr:serine/threonine-protein kinase [Polyangiaceae bacterium LLY-WYZ-14_1]